MRHGFIPTSKTLLAALGALVPLPCPLCGAEPAGGEPNMFCPECLSKLRFVAPPACPACGGELYGILEVCPDCLKSEKRPWGKAVSVFKMTGEAENVIHLFKYRRRPDLARPLGALAAKALAKSGLSPDVIVPTPLHWFRSLCRGFNQAQLLAETLSAATGIPVSCALKRARWTKQQARLGREARRRNLQDAFSAPDSTRCQNRSILLLDDVMTTGSTLTAATKALLAAGASKVDVLVMARRQRD